MQIDETDFEKAPDTLRFSDAQVQARFELGVSLAVHAWDTLDVAVALGWGGPQLADKRDWMAGLVVELFDGPEVDIALIEETLLYAMVDEFDTQVEDDLALPVAANVMKAYRQCRAGEFGEIEALFQRWQEKQARGARPGVKVEGDESDEEEGDSDEEMEVDTPLQPPSQPEPTGPIVDDDGFELVQRRRR